MKEIAFIAFLMFICSCSQNRSMVVLLPEPDGKVGQLEVQTPSGNQVINEAYRGVTLDREHSPISLQESDIQERFAAALSAHPTPNYSIWNGRLFCKWDSSELTDDSKATSKKLIKSVKGLEPVEIFMVGHTDHLGSEDYNLKLSRKRATTVSKLLSAQGIKCPIFIIALGKSKPLVESTAEESQILNRRVEIFVKYKPHTTN